MINYASPVKSARLRVVMRALAGGRVVFSDGVGDIVSVPLGRSSLQGDTLELFGGEGIADRDGYATDARLEGQDGLVADGLTVGEHMADVVIDSRSLVAGQSVRIVSAVIRHP